MFLFLFIKRKKKDFFFFLPVTERPVVRQEGATELQVGVANDVVEIGSPNVVVVEELSEFTSEADVALVDEVVLLVAVALVRRHQVAQIRLRRLIRQVNRLALVPLVVHFVVVARALVLQPRAEDGPAGEEDEDGLAGDPALAVDGEHAHGGEAAGHRALLAVRLAGEPGVEGLRVVGDGITKSVDACEVQHMIFFCFSFFSLSTKNK
jgi:hypothetical protein